MSSITPRPRVVIVDGVPMSALVAEATQPRAVALALHGGGTTAAYFDSPGHPSLSLLRLGAALGFTVITLDRPGYGSSAPYPEVVAQPEQQVALAYGAVDRILGERPRGAGLFLLAHSKGCELALRMAVGNDDVLGIEMAGTGRHYHPDACEVLKAASPAHNPPGLRELLWRPTHLYPADVLGGRTNSAGGAPYEAAMVSSWPRHGFPALAARVRVPVQFSVAEYEKVWQSDSTALAEIAALFSVAQRFCVNEQRNAAHNLSLGHTAAAYHLKALSFAEECVVARERSADSDLEAG
jgi:pimeloyl-ACP methyl ester carboxylesterase